MRNIHSATFVLCSFTAALGMNVLLLWSASLITEKIISFSSATRTEECQGRAPHLCAGTQKCPQLWKRLSWVRHFSTGKDARDLSSSILWRSIRKVVLFPGEFSLKDWESELVTHCLMVSSVRGEGLRFSLHPAGHSDLSAHLPCVGENSPELHPQVPCCTPEPRGGACGGSRV